jgi:hypothetical protein
VKVKCYFQICPEVIEAPDDSAAIAAGPTATVLSAGILFGHSQYVRVPGGNRKLPGRPWVCPYHDTVVGATLTLTETEERQRQSLVAQLRTGKIYFKSSFLG